MRWLLTRLTECGRHGESYPRELEDQDQGACIKKRSIPPLGQAQRPSEIVCSKRPDLVSAHP